MAKQSCESLTLSHQGPESSRLASRWRGAYGFFNQGCVRFGGVKASLVFIIIFIFWKLCLGMRHISVAAKLPSLKPFGRHADLAPLSYHRRDLSQPSICFQPGGRSPHHHCGRGLGQWGSPSASPWNMQLHEPFGAFGASRAAILLRVKQHILCKRRLSKICLGLR